MPLTTAKTNTGRAGQEQAESPELPAWLESLRVHKQPVANTSGSQPFTMAELVDEHSTPSWMRQDQLRLSEAGTSDALPVVSSTGKADLFSKSLEASSLIDEQSLPTWMREAQEQTQQTEEQGFSAHSLVQQDALPQWMKNLAPSAEVPTPLPSGNERYGLPTQAPSMAPNSGKMPPTPQTPQPSFESNVPQTPITALPNELMPAQGFAAHALVDQQAIPDWMKDLQGSNRASTSGPLSASFAASELIDQRTLPTWIKEQHGSDAVDPVSAMGVPVKGSGQNMGMSQGMQESLGVPAATLIDHNALPTWMSQDEQRGGSSGQGVPQQGMAAGSLIDLNAMPTWMKNMESSQPRGGTQSGPTHVEGMRVPSRPRSNMLPQDQSAVAANVFSSMLGVSASTPLLQGQPPMPEPYLGVAQGQVAQPQQGQSHPSAWQAPQPTSGPAWQTPQPSPMAQNEPAWQTVQPSPMTQNSAPQAPSEFQGEQAWQAMAAANSGPSWQVPQTPPMAQSGSAWQAAHSSLPQGNWMGTAPATPLSSPGGLAGSTSGHVGQRPSSAGYGGQSETYQSGSGQATLGGGRSQSGDTENTKKKSVFEAIRDFFFH